MRHIINHKRLTAFIAAAGVVALTAVAIAYWTGTGGGSGTATVGTAGTVTLTATVGGTPAPGLSVPVSFAAANSGTSNVYVSTVHLVSVTADSGHSTCTTADFSMADVTESHDVPAAATAEALPTNGSLVYANTGVSQDACKGATLTLTLTSS